MTMRGHIVAIAMVGLMMIPGFASSQEVKIAYVNVQRLGTESTQAKTSLEALQEEFAARQRELVAAQNAFQEKQAQLQRDVEVMGPEERRNAEQNLRKEERELARNQQEFREDANLRQNEVLGKLQRALLREVQAYAQKTGYDLVVSEGVLYASSAIDITEKVLAGLDSSFEQEKSGN